MNETGVMLDLLKAAVTALPSDKLSAIRQQAVSRFVADGFPTTKHEDWKYTSLSAAAELSNQWLQESPTQTDTAPATIGSEIPAQIDARWITIINGVVDAGSLQALGELGGDGITIARLADDINGAAIIVDEPMSAFNAALLQDGLHIKVAAGASVDKPIGLLLIDDGSAAVTQFRVLVDVGENANLKIIECPISTGSNQQFSNTVSQIMLADCAELDFVRLQQRDKQHLSVNRFAASLQRDSVLNYNNFEFGGELVRNDIVADITGAGAEAIFRGLYLAAGQQHIDNHTRVDHRVGPAKSTEEYRGILNGRSRCVFNGKAIVHAGADGTDADQSNHNLLLSDRAEIDTKPELEIYADDVKCSHGATVGQLDKAALFYLRSRGLDKDEATQALTRAFASAILGKLAIEECRDYLTAILDTQLDALIDEEKL